jgi:hypothetical protein
LDLLSFTTADEFGRLKGQISYLVLTYRTGSMPWCNFWQWKNALATGLKNLTRQRAKPHFCEKRKNGQPAQIYLERVALGDAFGTRLRLGCEIWKSGANYPRT